MLWTSTRVAMVNTQVRTQARPRELRQGHPVVEGRELVRVAGLRLPHELLGVQGKIGVRLGPDHCRFAQYWSDPG